MATMAMPKDDISDPRSQFTVEVRLTEAVASAPSLPTIAVSTYCRRVERISSATIGRARAIIEEKVSLFPSFIISGQP